MSFHACVFRAAVSSCFTLRSVWRLVRLHALSAKAKNQVVRPTPNAETGVFAVLERVFASWVMSMPPSKVTQAETIG
jgi:hypothetical protein